MCGHLRKLHAYLGIANWTKIAPLFSRVFRLTKWLPRACEMLTSLPMQRGHLVVLGKSNILRQDSRACLLTYSNAPLPVRRALDIAAQLAAWKTWRDRQM
jgi:hypothetical protein